MSTSRPSDAAHEPQSAAGGGAEMESWSRALDLRSLAAEYGTPLYIIDSNTLRANFAAYLGLVDRPERIRYPVKANPSAAILETIAELGGGADCASRAEVWAALDAGIPIEHVTYNAPAPEPAFAVWLVQSGATVVADSVEALDDLREGVGDGRPAGRLFVRVSPGGLPGYRSASEIHRYTAHGSENSPFGIPSETLSEVLADYPVPVTGLHMHVGTQMDNLETFVSALDFLHELRERLEDRTPHRFSTLNLGGGLGIPFLDDQSFPSVSQLVEALRPLRREGLAYEVEPGNSLVGNAVALLARVTALKTARGRRWGILDVGTDQLVKFTIARWEHRIDDADHRSLPREGPDGLVGPLCFAGDAFLSQTRLDGVKRGDPVLIRHAGAYCEAVANHFNGRRGPAHILIAPDGSMRRVRRAEDLFFEPRLLGHVPVGMDADMDGEPIPDETVEALQSTYMHTGAAEEGYTIGAARRVGERASQFEILAETEVTFVGMPLALRIAGDTSIIAVGHLLGWRNKAGPMWATHLSFTYRGTPPIDGPFPCRVSIGGLRLAPSARVAYVTTARFEIGSGEVIGSARVVVPTESVEAEANA